MYSGGGKPSFRERESSGPELGQWDLTLGGIQDAIFEEKSSGFFLHKKRRFW